MRAKVSSGGKKTPKNPVAFLPVLPEKGHALDHARASAVPGPHPHAARQIKRQVRRQVRKAPNRGVPKGTHVSKGGNVVANKGKQGK